MSFEPERRRMGRITASIDVEIQAEGDERPIIGQLWNLSVVGLRLEAERPLPVGTTCSIRMFVPEEVALRGKVVRAEGNDLAFQLEDVPYESFERLRAFLLMHAEENSAIEDELTDRMGYLADEF
jgi:hypothetical protein